MKTSYLILAAGSPPKVSFCKRLLPFVENVVSVDGGIKLAEKMLVRPNLHVGDFDSVSKAVHRKVSPKSTIELPRRKNRSDFEFALNVLPPNTWKLVVGAHRDNDHRPDHAFSNLLLGPVHQCIFVDDETTVIGLSSRNKIQFSAPKGTTFSVISLDEQKVSILGSKFELRNSKFLSDTHGIGNEASKTPITVSSQGRVLIFIQSSILKLKIAAKRPS